MLKKFILYTVIGMCLLYSRIFSILTGASLQYNLKFNEINTNIFTHIITQVGKVVNI
jgi:hypothetical protein